MTTALRSLDQHAARRATSCALCKRERFLELFTNIIGESAHHASRRKCRLRALQHTRRYFAVDGGPQRLSDADGNAAATHVEDAIDHTSALLSTSEATAS